MASVFDVAAYILEKQSEMTAMKLQKLVYYAQAWSLVWEEKPLFRDKIKAWDNGPVVPQLYTELKGRFSVRKSHLSQGDSSALDDSERSTIDAVLKFYGDKSAQWLSDLTHQERPWRDARNGASPDDKSPEITRSSLAEYYGSLPPI